MASDNEQVAVIQEAMPATEQRIPGPNVRPVGRVINIVVPHNGVGSIWMISAWSFHKKELVMSREGYHVYSNHHGKAMVLEQSNTLCNGPQCVS